MKKNVLIFGLIAGCIAGLLVIVSTTMCYNNSNFEGNMLLGYAGMLLAFSLVFAGIKNYRDKYLNGAISFAGAFKTGALIVMITSTIYVVVWLFDFYLFVPDFMDKYAAHVIAQAKNEGASPAELNKQIASMTNYKEMYKNPLWVILLTYAEIVPVGIIVTLISALVLMKRRPTATESAAAL